MLPVIKIERDGDVHRAYLFDGNGKKITVGGGWAATGWFVADWSRAVVRRKVKRLKYLFAKAEIM